MDKQEPNKGSNCLNKIEYRTKNSKYYYSNVFDRPQFAYT